MDTALMALAGIVSLLSLLILVKNLINGKTTWEKIVNDEWKLLSFLLDCAIISIAVSFLF
jgi:hypothetical protein